MRIASLSRISAGILLVAIAGVATSVFWGLQQLQLPFDLKQNYFQVVEQVSVKTRQKIENYLSTGNAADLQAAQEFLSGELHQSLARLPQQLSTTLESPLATLQQGLETDLRAAGKLAGETQGLLLQNERETLDLLESLADYASSAPEQNRTEANRYQQLVSQAAILVARRAVQRSSYFGSPNDTRLQSLIKQSHELQALVDQVRSQAELGVWKTEDIDDFAAMMGGDAQEQGRTEIGDELKSALAYTVSRYVGEIERTAAGVRDGQLAEAQVAALVSDLEQQLVQGQSYLDQIKSDIEFNVITIVSLLLVLLLVVSVTSSLIQIRFVRGVGKVVHYLQYLSSGDFSRQMPEGKTFQELNDLRQSANKVQSYLRQLVTEIRKEVIAFDQASTNIDRAAVAIHDSTLIQGERTSESEQAISQLVESFRLVASHAVEASDAANQGQTAVAHSAQEMEKLEQTIGELAGEVAESSRAINQLRDDSDSIESVLNVIISIAEQTNLLALNAAIEAARAGDHGRGFAVVADEVRQLAQRTADSTQEIRGIVEGLHQSSKHAVQMMDNQQVQAELSVERTQQAADRLQQVVTAIEKIQGLNTLIAQATEEQTGSAASVQASIVEIQQHSSGAADQTAEAHQQSEKLSKVSGQLKGLVECFTV